MQCHRTEDNNQKNGVQFMRKAGATAGMMLLLTGMVFGEDCTLGERYATLAAKSKAAYEDHDAYDFLNRAVEVCPRFDYWIELGETSTSLADPDATKRAGEAFVEAYAVASTSEQQAYSAARYAQLLFNNGDPQRALRYAFYAKNLTPSIPWIDELADRISKRIAEAKPDDIRRGLGDVIFRPLRLADFGPTNRVPSTARKSDVVASRSEISAINVPINFRYNSTDVDPAMLQNIATLAHVLADPQYVGRRFTFVGHSDLRGEADYNRILSLRRAIALQNQVTSIEPSLAGRIEPMGRGKDQPLSYGPTEEDQRVNRRLEVIQN